MKAIIGGVLIGLALVVSLWILADTLIEAPNRVSDFSGEWCHEEIECTPEHIAKLTSHVYYCDPLVEGDCDADGLAALSEHGYFRVMVNDDPEYGCNSCEDGE